MSSTVIGAVESGADREPFCGVPSVPVGGTSFSIGQEMVVNHHIWLVRLAVFPAALLPWDVIGINVQFIQMA